MGFLKLISNIFSRKKKKPDLEFERLKQECNKMNSKRRKEYNNFFEQDEEKIIYKKEIYPEEYFISPSEVIDEYYWNLKPNAKMKLEERISNLQEEICESFADYDFRAIDYRKRTCSLNDIEKKRYLQSEVRKTYDYKVA